MGVGSPSDRRPLYLPISYLLVTGPMCTFVKASTTVMLSPLHHMDLTYIQHVFDMLTCI